MEQENMTLEQDILENIQATSEALTEQSAGTDERMTEAKIYDMQVKEINEHYKLLNEQENNDRKLELEKYKIDEDIKLRREMEQQRIKIEELKAKNENAALWTKVGLLALIYGAEIGTGILYLKANMKYGGMLGKDAKGWFDNLRRIKL